MLVRVQFRLQCPSEADAQQVRDAIAQKLGTKPLAVTHSAVSVGRDSSGERWQVAGDVSFQLRVDADDVFTDAQAKWSSGALRNRILAGSTVTLHVCPHAGGEPPPYADCRTIDYQLATKAG
jgi:hypothetical protein